MSLGVLCLDDPIHGLLSPVSIEDLGVDYDSVTDYDCRACRILAGDGFTRYPLVKGRRPRGRAL